VNNGVHSATLSHGGNPYRHSDFHQGPWHSLAAAFAGHGTLRNLQTSHVKEADLPFRAYAAEGQLTCGPQVHVPFRVQRPATGQLPRLKKGVLSFPSLLITEVQAL
jgi:hypothetical protein